MGKRSSFDFEEEDDAHEALRRAGQALLSHPKGKDQLLRLLKVRLRLAAALAPRLPPQLVIMCSDGTLGGLQSAGDSLAEAAQSSENAKLAARDLAKALGGSEFVRHKDKVGKGSTKA